MTILSSLAQQMVSLKGFMVYLHFQGFWVVIIKIALFKSWLSAVALLLQETTINYLNQILVFGEREKWEYVEKTSWIRVKNQQTQSIHYIEAGIEPMSHWWRRSVVTVVPKPSRSCVGDEPSQVLTLRYFVSPSCGLRLLVLYPTLGGFVTLYSGLPSCKKNITYE